MTTRLTVWTLLVLASFGAKGAFAQSCDVADNAGLVAFDIKHSTVLGYVPESAVGQAAPLVVNLHPTGGTGLRSIRDAQAVSDTEGFVMVAPTGEIGPIFSGWTWNVPGVPTFGTDEYPEEDARDDVAFISEAIDKMTELACIDTSRVYVIGYSGGGRMASRLACDLGDKIAAVVPIGGIRFGLASDKELGLPQALECDPSRPVPMAAIHGHWDPINPWYEEELGETPFKNPFVEGENYSASAPKQGSSWSYAGETALARWVSHNGCEATPVVTSLADGVEQRDYPSCDAGGDVSLVFFQNFGHAVPGYDEYHLQGQSESPINGYALAWDLLKHHSLPN